MTTTKSKRCAFCGSDGPLTKEHLWPRSLHKRLEDANNGSSHHFWLKRLKQDIPSEPQVRDVCAQCNNGVLSELDSYICKLFDSQLVHMPKRHETVQVSFQYHLLKRWLLKLSFNSARIHNSQDRIALEILRPYIMGSNLLLGRSVQLFLQLTFPELVPEYDLKSEFRDEQILCEPDINRIGFMLFRVNGIGEKVLRAIHLRSYMFLIAYWDPSTSRAEQDLFEKVLLSRHRSASLLRPSKQLVQLECDGIGAWESWRGSQSNELIFKIDD